jgi:hypothetical protein
VALSEKTLIPGDDARLGEARFETWLSQSSDQTQDKNRQPAAGTAVNQ